MHLRCFGSSKDREVVLAGWNEFQEVNMNKGDAYRSTAGIVMFSGTS